jgi:hypothetical protein
MRITFLSDEAARTAVEIWERHGFAARLTGRTVETDGPTLWAVPIIHRNVGFHQIENLDILHPRPGGRTPDDDRVEAA